MILKDWKEKNASSITAKYEYWRIIFNLLMDEESMVNRQFWGWFKHRLEEFRKMKFKIDEDLNIKLLLHDKYTELTKDFLVGNQLFTL